MKKIQIVDRKQFIAWTKGIFLQRDRFNILIVNENACQLAFDELRKGNKIFFTIDNKIISYCILKNNKYVEKKIGR
jgi:hypothetical protein